MKKLQLTTCKCQSFSGGGGCGCQEESGLMTLHWIWTNPEPNTKTKLDTDIDTNTMWTHERREFQQRISESQEVHGKMRTQLHLVDKEVFVQIHFKLQIYVFLFTQIDHSYYESSISNPDCKKILEMDCLIDQLGQSKKAKQGPLKVLIYNHSPANSF